MEHPKLLVDFLILLGVSIPISYVFHRFKLPVIVGFLVTGIIVGPSALGLISGSEVQAMAEIGVVLLLFTIGLEFSLKEIFQMGWRLLGTGIAQVILTVSAAAGVAAWFGLNWRQSLAVGFLISLSSSAIVLKILSDRNEISTPHGKVIVAVSLVQDLSIIPMMLLIPALSGESLEFLNLAKQLGLAFATIAVLVLVSRYLVPLILSHVVKQRNRDLFLATIIFVIFGTAYATASIGLSLAIGAFIAGLVIAESKYTHQVLSDILPFRDTFSAIFFISVGMLLDVAVFAHNWKIDVQLTLAILFGKALILLVILVAIRQLFRISLMAAFSLAQVGEFSFLLMQQSRNAGLVPDRLSQPLLAASVITMLLTPFVIVAAGPIGFRLQKLLGSRDLPPKPPDEERRDHLVVVGYGLNGRNLVSVVRGVGIPFVVVELNDELVKEAQEEDVPVVFGDATRSEVLSIADADKARVAVIAISDQRATRTVVAVLRNMNPSLVIIVRTRYVVEVEPLMRLGANSVIPEEFETSVEIFARVLEHYGIPEHLIEQQVEVIRSETYGMLRGLSLSQERLLKISELFLKSTVQQCVLAEHSPAAHTTLRELNLRGETGATVLVVIRGDLANNNPDPDFRLQAGDVLVLWGAHQQLSEAMKKLSPQQQA